MDMVEGSKDRFNSLLKIATIIVCYFIPWSQPSGPHPCCTQYTVNRRELAHMVYRIATQWDGLRRGELLAILLFVQQAILQVYRMTLLPSKEIDKKKGCINHQQ